MLENTLLSLIGRCHTECRVLRIYACRFKSASDCALVDQGRATRYHRGSYSPVNYVLCPTAVAHSSGSPYSRNGVHRGLRSSFWDFLSMRWTALLVLGALAAG